MWIAGAVEGGGEGEGEGDILGWVGLVGRWGVERISFDGLFPGA